MAACLVIKDESTGVRPDVGIRETLAVLGAAVAFVVLTRLPVVRPEPFEWDEIGYLQMIAQYRLPMHHTLFLAMARLIGLALHDPYRGFVALDMGMSALALVSIWWWLRAVVRPATAVAATLVLAVAPTFWSYGAMAGNYTAIPFVGGFLLGVAVRTWRDPKAWHPYAAAAVLAFGAGYRQDIGTFWSPIFLVILWRHRWKAAIGAGVLFVVLNFAWFLPMLVEVGGWANYRAKSKEFASTAGYRNSVFYLGLVDASARYVVKLALANFWTFGLALLAVPFGVSRLLRGASEGRNLAQNFPPQSGDKPGLMLTPSLPVGEGRVGGRSRDGWFLPSVLLLSVLPALAFHLTIHFGVPGYAFHYVPALIALAAIGAGATIRGEGAPVRLIAIAAISAVVFLGYQPDYDRPGTRGSFDLSVGRYTRIGLVTRPPDRLPSTWRTANSVSIKKPIPRYSDGQFVPVPPSHLQ
jgi:hypothetical protein